jgi:hypothetical protein
MAQGFDFNYDVSDELKAHYNKLREDRGWSWDTLAEDFERQWTDPGAPGLAAWARAQGKPSAKSSRAADKGTEKRG